MAEQYVKKEYPMSDVTARIIAAATEVHRTLGPGFEEVIYQRPQCNQNPFSASVILRRPTTQK